MIPEAALRGRLDAEINLKFLKDTGEHFGVTIPFLLDRLQSLKILKPTGRIALLNEYKEAGIPNLRPKEIPTLFAKWLFDLQEKENLDLQSFADYLHLSLDDLMKQMGLRHY